MQIIARIDTLPVGRTTQFFYRERPAILVHDEDGIHAFVNICTHEGGELELVGRDLTCCLHGARFNPRTGKALCGPAPLDSRLTAIPVRVDADGTITVDDGHHV